MKTTLRYVLGVLSSLLLAVGLRAAADHLDPLSSEVPDASSNSVLAGAASCNQPCSIDDGQ